MAETEDNATNRDKSNQVNVRWQYHSTMQKVHWRVSRMIGLWDSLFHDFSITAILVS